MVNKNSIIIIHSCLLSLFTLGFTHTAFFYMYKYVEIIQYHTSIQIYWTTTSWSLLGPGVEVGLTPSFIDYIGLSLK
jgi:hypothetical protein